MTELFTDYWWQLILVAIGSFALGGINFAILFTKAIKHEDIRDVGSGNAGTTNVFRVFGLRMGALTFVCDLLKGVIPCVACLLIFSFTDAAPFVYWAGGFAVAGHIFPPFHGFRGGKGIATSMGVCLVAQPILMLCCVLPMILLIFIVDRMSVISLLFAAFMIVWHWTMLLDSVGLAPCVFLTVMFALVIFAHRHNIVRICTGKEMATGVRAKLLRKSKNKNQPANETVEGTSEVENTSVVEVTSEVNNTSEVEDMSTANSAPEQNSTEQQ